MSNNYDSLLDLDSLPTTDYNVGTTSSVPDIAFAAPALQQQVLSLDIFAHGVPEEISNTDLLNAFGPMDRVVKKEPTLGRLLFDGLATPSPGLLNLMMGIDGQLHPAQNMNVVQNSHTSPVVPRPLSPSPPPAARQPTARPRRASTQQRHPRFVHSPSPSPPPPPRSTAGKKIKTEDFFGYGSRPLVGSQNVPRAVPRKHKSMPSSPHDIAVLRLFPVELLRSDRDTYKAALQAHQAKLSKPQLFRLRALRRKELSCVYADNARHRRIGRMELLEEKVGNLEAENEALRKQLANFV